MTTDEPPELNSGSRWHRWEPHIHAPGTILNDQYTGENAWERYLAALETATPAIRVLGVTDYYSTGCYERVREAKSSGRLAGMEVIFPNIEMRLAIGTVKGRWVNVHLLVSSEDPDHLAELKRFLARLRFQTDKDWYYCTRDDLIRLGKQSDPAIASDDAALKEGTRQFKISLDELREIYRGSDWAKANILVAVAGSEGDGSSGVRDAADTMLRQEVEKFAHVIFAGSPSQRDFWLGLKNADEEELRQRYGGLKPCLHGSDAHDHKSIGAPDGARYSWIKGALAFDTLRQACIDPAGRAFVGPEPPIAATPSQVIAQIDVRGASWAQTPALALNPGLVAIIGARGSGKTALADMIAAGCDAFPERPTEASFIERARDLLVGASVRLEWQAGDQSERALDDVAVSSGQYPRARYLSQQFVEKLCTAQGMTDELLGEIERVIFEAHPAVMRDGAADFPDLLDLRTARYREARSREEVALADVSDRIGTELEKDKLVPTLKQQVAEKARLIERYTGDRAKLVPKGSEARVGRLAAVTAAADKVRGYVQFFSGREQSLLALKDEVVDVRQNQAPEALRRAKERYAASGLKDAAWSPFLLGYTGDVDTTLAENLAAARSTMASWKGTTPADGTAQAAVPDDAVLEELPLAVLQGEITRLQKEISVDRTTADKFAAVSRRITEESAALERLKEKLAHCELAKGRVTELVQERQEGYKRVFGAILAEQAVLAELYAPLMARLEAAEGTLRKLSFSIKRVVDVEQWATAGEERLDLRRQGSFKGRGALRQQAEAILKPAWETGDAESVAAAMTAFRSQHQDELLANAPVPKTDQAAVRAWLKRFAQWLYGTDHIAIRYGIEYDGTDIRKLSPGTRGIVLLLLYLALDDADDRPLIIDQPEESLDPKSIFDELVHLFVDSKSKRQIIMVTHNANLVVNTDADQIIVARAGPHAPGELPPISYESGGLESARIRKAVCDILEGGEPAFRERARRLRVHLNR